MEIVTIYDELDRPYLCEVEGTRVLRVIESPVPLPDDRSVTPTYWVTETDVRFGSEPESDMERDRR